MSECTAHVLTETLRTDMGLVWLIGASQQFFAGFPERATVWIQKGESTVFVYGNVRALVTGGSPIELQNWDAVVLHDPPAGEPGS